MERSSASEGAAGSLRSEVPETERVRDVLTMSVASRSVTSSAPEELKVSFVSSKSLFLTND